MDVDSLTVLTGGDISWVEITVGRPRAGGRAGGWADGRAVSGPME